jgi:serine protease Do
MRKMLEVKDFRKKTPGFFAVLMFAVSLFASGTIAQVPTNSTPNVTPEKLSASFAEVSKRVEAAVVNIDTKGKVPDVAVKEPPQDGSVDDLMDFLRRQQRRPTAAVGSGFIVDKSGYIMTNAHVVEDSSRITVRLTNGDEFPARIIGMDEETDLAVLKIEAGRDLQSIKLGDSDKARIGDWVLAIGSPFGLAQTVTAGIISQTQRETPYASVFQKFIQTDAAINRGNSGGPLVNMEGEVIGINSQIATSTGDYNGIGFALPSNEAAYVYRQILENGKVRRGFLGVSLDSVKTEFARVYNLKDMRGAIILNVTEKDSAAGRAGLQANDVIVEFNNQPITSAQDLIAKVASTTPEQAVTIGYLRENGASLERKTVSIKLDERPSNNKVIGDLDTPQKMPIGPRETDKPLGLTLTEMTPKDAETARFENERGLLVKNINPASYIADVKLSNGADALREGDLIQRVNRIPVTDLKTFNAVAGKLKKGDAVVLHVLFFNPGTRNLQPKIIQFTVQ